MTAARTTKAKPITPTSAAQAFDAMRKEIEAVPADELVPINVDISAACTVALGAADRLEQLSELLGGMPRFDHKAVKNLRSYALAALYANAVATEQTPEDAVTSLLVEAAPLRENMLVAAEALAHRGILKAQRVAEIRSGQGHLDTADDLIALSALYRDSWHLVERKTTVTRDEVERSAVLGSQLHIALGARRVGIDVARLQLLRERAFTLFARAYDECRRAVTYLRWHEGDADEYAPSIYARRKRRVEENEATGSDLPVATGPAPAGSSAANGTSLLT